MERTKCDECGGTIVQKKTDFSLYGQSLGMFPAQVCSKCGETVFTEEVSDKIDIIAKEKGLWGLDLTTKVSQAGDSLMIRINKKLADFMGLKKGEEVHIHPQNKKRIVIEV